MDKEIISWLQEEDLSDLIEMFTIVLSFKSSEELATLDFEELLKNHSLKSNAALENFKKTGMLTDSDRSAITEAVANTLLHLTQL
ncbi:uncharacterized protein LOC113003774 [Solenopsis invicta]|uniref:uncharacterized protein LOC113003774 n=1 Tax=Solenopsis invicta TaxID=13686 RepID=UPI00193D99FD|nr:uncharacterized protein LOC113003774 [Solenopsis invicta]